MYYENNIMDEEYKKLSIEKVCFIIGLFSLASRAQGNLLLPLLTFVFIFIQMYVYDISTYVIKSVVRIIFRGL